MKSGALARLQHSAQQHLLTSVLVLLLSVCGVAQAQTVPSTDNRMPSLAPMLEKITPAVVNISVTRIKPGPEASRPGADSPRARPRMSRGAGSGVVIDSEEGYIITNHHVVEGAREITVALLDGRVLEAELVGSDEPTDIALLKIEADNLSAVEFANVDQLRIGDYVVAIGNPFGIGQTVTSGIISALGRAGINNKGYEDFIQTDAAINVGNSGGALVDLNGRLVGINTAIISRTGTNSGVGFAVPADMVTAVKTHLARDGVVRRGQLGVLIHDHTPMVEETLQLGAAQGALVTGVMPGSVAEKSGLQVSDLVVMVNGKPIQGSRELRNAVGLAGVDQELKLGVLRGGERLDFSVTIVVAEDDSAVAARDSGRRADETRFLGAELQDGSAHGVEVAGVAQRSPAWAAGLRPGDVIEQVNRESTENLSQFNQLLGQKPKVLALGVVRDGQKLLLIMS